MNELSLRHPPSSIEHGGTSTLYNFMALLTLSNEVAGTHDEAPKRKNIALHNDPQLIVEQLLGSVRIK